jgi:hypothetical protein
MPSATNKMKGAATDSSTRVIAGGIVGGFCGLIILGVVIGRVHRIQPLRRALGHEDDVIALSSLYFDKQNDLQSSQNTGTIAEGNRGSFV